MKRRVILGSLGMLLAGPLASAAPLAPLDTIPGHGPLVRAIGDSLCARLDSKRQHVDFRQLKPEQSERILNGMLHQLVRENRAAVENIIFAVRPVEQARYRRRLGRDILLHLADECSSAHQLITDIGYHSLHDKSPMPPAEQAVLLPVALSISSELAAADRRDPFEDYPPSEEKRLILQMIHACIIAAEPVLSSYYGEGFSTDPARLSNMAERLTFVLLNHSPKYLLMLSLRH